MNLRQIEVFRAVMTAGSVVDAARLLHVSQPGISRMLGHIELQLGLKLFERGHGRLRPTAEARALQAEVERVYRGVEQIERRASELKSGGGLTLRILTSPSVGLEVVPAALTALGARYPAARFYLETQFAREMTGQLLREEADLAISTFPITQAPLVTDIVGRWSLTCVFRPGHSFDGRRSISPRDLRGQEVIAFAPDTPQSRVLADGPWGRDRATASRFEVRSGQAACALAASGAGIAIVDHLTASAFRGDRLGTVPLARSPSFPIFAVRHADTGRSALESALIEQLRALLDR